MSFRVFRAGKVNGPGGSRRSEWMSPAEDTRDSRLLPGRSNRTADIGYSWSLDNEIPRRWQGCGIWITLPAAEVGLVASSVLPPVPPIALTSRVTFLPIPPPLAFFSLSLAAHARDPIHDP